MEYVFRGLGFGVWLCFGVWRGLGFVEFFGGGKGLSRFRKELYEALA